MQAKQFYQTKRDTAWPLYFLSQKDWESGLQDQSIQEKQWFLNQQFNGSLGDLCFLTDSQGLIQKVYLGTGAGLPDEEATVLAKMVSLLPPGAYLPQSPLSDFAKLNWALAQYRFTRYKKNETKPRILIIDEEAYSNVLIDANATFLTRDLINTPANDMGPSHLAFAMSELAKTFKATFKQWVGQDLLSSNFPAIHTVGRAASDAPRLLSLTWGDSTAPHIVLVGKGVCFDTGGLDIKPANNMRWMKKDMGGAAHVLGLAQWIMSHHLPLYLEVLIPAVENAVGSNSYRPGDVLTMRNGLSVEVDNTDAEGRLVLADALSKASESNPLLIIDFATLTGAARVAVGTDIAAMFTNNEDLALQLMQKSKAVHDPLWPLPLFPDYESMLDSKIADLSNCSPSPYAGASVAALFLQRFIGKNIPWVHFDMMAWNERSKPGRPEGGEAMGLRAVGYYLKDKYGSLGQDPTKVLV